MLGKPLAQQRLQVIERAVVAEVRAGAPRPFVDDRTRPVLRHEVRRVMEAFCLSANDHRQSSVRFHEKQRELEARRACVQYGDRVCHCQGTPFFRFAPRSLSWLAGSTLGLKMG
jgi:hypothetical protein